MRTAQQIADAAAKRTATRAANKAAGVSVRQQRAAAKAAKLGQPAPPPVAQRPTPPPNPYSGRSRRRRRASSFYTTPPVPQVPVFSTPKPNYRALKLAAMVALETAFVQKLEDAGGVATLTDDTRTAFARYKKLKALALGACASTFAQTEADSALTRATLDLVKLAY